MTTLDQDILIRNGFIAVATDHSIEANLYAPIQQDVATIISNLATYGYTVDRFGYEALLSATNLGSWWIEAEAVLKSITGTDRNMGEYMVYKNFPREVLEMSQAESVIKQILIYLGVPYDALREEEVARPPLGDMKRLKVLALADDGCADRIYDNLAAMRNRWSDNQSNWAGRLVGSRNAIVCGDFGFKENAIALAKTNFETMEFVPASATDVMRLAAALSGGDVSLREKVKFRHFKRAERRRLLAALETQTGIAEDMASRPGPWKRLIEHLRPGDYTPKYLKVESEFDALYNGQAKSFAAMVDPQHPTEETLAIVATRPGEFLRRFHHFYGLFGLDAVEKFIGVMDKLSTRQLAGLRGYLRTIDDRTYLMSPPRSNWSKVKIRGNEKTKFVPEHLRMLDTAISNVFSARLKKAYPEGIALDMHVDNVRLQTNDQKLAEYGRGTEFEIPLEIKFLRSASYWEHGDRGVVWFDNGWNFFDDNWAPMGACCWNAQLHDAKAAVFSGDPVNIKHDGKGCQMVDLYFDKLGASGVRFAVWSILCYSRRPFSTAKEVLATLQMGEHAEKGKVYEPSRAQMVFPIKSETYTNYVAYLDVARRKLVYMDAALPGAVQSAQMNEQRLSEIMPAYVEYLESLPTMLEVLQDAPQGTMPVLYSDERHEIRDGRRAFVFRPENPQNAFERVSVTDLLNV